nr:zinc finger MYM-type protein 1-like [Hydra vulgaris]
MDNGEKNHRTWLVYSQKANKVFCFCCKLFCLNPIILAQNGGNDWRHISRILKRHEKSLDHFNCYSKWVDLKNRFQKGTLIDKILDKNLIKEVEHWDNVMRRLISLTIMMAKQNMPLRGSCDKVYHNNNGNFLKIYNFWLNLIQLWKNICLEQKKKKTNYVHYLAKDIQNELINLIGKSIKFKIFSNVQKSVYFSIIVDCTLDISHQEQMSELVRYVDVEDKNEIHINESFIGFHLIEGSTGLDLSNKIIDSLVKNNLSVEKIRGQCYDNGANMKGVRNGVQAFILKTNNRAVYIPCCSHTLNLAVVDSVRCSPKIVIWLILQSKCPSLTVKPLSDTRWENHTNAVKTLRFEMPKIYEALQDAAKTANETIAKITAESIALKITSFDFLCSIVIWHKVLFEINMTSKQLQAASTNISEALKAMERTINFFKENYKQEKFDSVVCIASFLKVKESFASESASRVETLKVALVSLEES